MQVSVMADNTANSINVRVAADISAIRQTVSQIPDMFNKAFGQATGHVKAHAAATHELQRHHEEAFKKMSEEVKKFGEHIDHAGERIFNLRNLILGTIGVEVANKIKEWGEAFIEAGAEAESFRT